MFSRQSFLKEIRLCFERRGKKHSCKNIYSIMCKSELEINTNDAESNVTNVI